MTAVWFPFIPETDLLIRDMDPGRIWTRYVRYIGAGAVATGGIITLIKSIPTMLESFRVGMKQLKKQIGDNAGINRAKDQTGSVAEGRRYQPADHHRLYLLWFPRFLPA